MRVQNLIQDFRIIPAYAGSTSGRAQHKTIAWDHPRVCGEHPTLDEFIGLCRGSSPRMRGARNEFVGVVLEFGIIPAYAGSTAADLCCASCSRDHPRVCGEHKPRYYK